MTLPVERLSCLTPKHRWHDLGLTTAPRPSGGVVGDFHRSGKGRLGRRMLAQA